MLNKTCHFTCLDVSTAGFLSQSNSSSMPNLSFLSQAPVGAQQPSGGENWVRLPWLSSKWVHYPFSPSIGPFSYSAFTSPTSLLIHASLFPTNDALIRAREGVHNLSGAAMVAPPERLPVTRVSQFLPQPLSLHIVASDRKWAGAAAATAALMLLLLLPQLPGQAKCVWHGDVFDIGCSLRACLDVRDSRWARCRSAARVQSPVILRNGEQPRRKLREPQPHCLDFCVHAVTHCLYFVTFGHSGFFHFFFNQRFAHSARATFVLTFRSALL